MGIDQLTGQSRLTFGVDQLGNGIDIVIVAVGLFAVGEALHMASRLRGGGDDEIVDPEEEIEGKGRWLSRDGLCGARGSRGCAAPASASRSARCRPAAPRCRRSSPTPTEKRLTKHPEEFGEGAIEGVAGPEAANNASFSGTLVPLLTLGIPTSATAAIMLAAFQIFNLQPGPELFTNNSELVWTLIASLYVGNVMLLAAQPAADPRVGEGARGPAAAALRGDPRVRDARRLLAVGAA